MDIQVTVITSQHLELYLIIYRNVIFRTRKRKLSKLQKLLAQMFASYYNVNIVSTKYYPFLDH